MGGTTDGTKRYNDYGNGVTFKGTYGEVKLRIPAGAVLNNVKYYPMLRYADILDDTYESYQPSVKEINAHIIDKTQKNLLDVINTSQDIEGVTYNVNSDKTITFSRVTAGNQSVFHLNSKNAAFMPNKYAGCLLSGCTSGSNSTYGLVAMYSNDGTNWANENWNFTSPVKILDYPYINIALVIRKNTTVSNVTVKPMICTEADYNISTEYTPYSPTNADIAESFAKVKSNIAINRTTLGTQCRNLHDTLSVNWYQPGKTSVASGGTVTTTITSDMRNFTYANSEHYITLEAGNYIITVNTLEFVSGSAALIRGCNSDNQSLFALPVSSAGLHKAAFSLSKKTTIGIMYKLYSQTCTIMIRDADILGDTYEPYKPSLQEQINQLSDTSNSGKLLYSMSEVVSSPLTVNITGLFTAYTAVVCNVVTSGDRHNLTLPLKYIKSLGTSAYYEADGILFYYVDDNKIKISTGLGQSNPTINAVKIISLF